MLRGGGGNSTLCVPRCIAIASLCKYAWRAICVPASNSHGCSCCVHMLQGGGGSSTSELLYYNAITSIPLLGSIMLMDGDVQSLWPTIAKGSAKHGLLPFMALVLTCSIMGCLLNYSLFLCTMHNSALTTTIVGVLKGVVAVGLGFVFDQVSGGARHDVGCWLLI